MSTTDRVTVSEPEQIDVIPNEEAGTVTFVADFDTDSSVPPAEWISVATEDVVDVQEHR